MPEPSPTNNDYLDQFYSLLLKFLTKNGLEKYTDGYSEDEIDQCQIQYSIEFPKAYKLFLQLMAKSELKIFDCSDFTFSGLSEAQEVSQELLEQDNYSLGENIFAFSQWQGYNFNYFDLKSENPNVGLYIEAGCAHENAPPEIYHYGPFTNWLCNKVEISLGLRNQLEGLKIENLLTDLKAIEKVGSLTNT